jgi:hypothetical protein
MESMPTREPETPAPLTRRTVQARAPRSWLRSRRSQTFGLAGLCGALGVALVVVTTSIVAAPSDGTSLPPEQAVSDVQTTPRATPTSTRGSGAPTPSASPTGSVASTPSASPTGAVAGDQGGSQPSEESVKAQAPAQAPAPAPATTPAGAAGAATQDPGASAPATTPAATRAPTPVPATTPAATPAPTTTPAEDEDAPDDSDGTPGQTKRPEKP